MADSSPDLPEPKPGRPNLSDEDVINSYLHRMGKAERLAPEEETYHTQRFYESRQRLGAYVSRFPRLVIKAIQACKTTQIQEFDESGQLESSAVDEKKKRIISLVSAIETVTDHLDRIATDVSEKTTRTALHRSLEQVLQHFLFHHAYYSDIFSQLQECRDRLGSDEEEQLVSEVLLMPAAEFLDSMQEIETCYEELDSARSTLLEANLRLVSNVARKYMKYGMSFQDLFQEGYLGMAVALDKFQPSRGHRFSTYAVWWIRQGITQALSSLSRTIRIPANMARFLSQVKRAEQQLLQVLGRDPTDEEIAEAVEQAPERVRAWRKIERQPISLESPVAGSAGTTKVSDLIVDASTKQPDEQVSSSLLKEAITEVLKTLDDREGTIIKHRFGLLGSSIMTLEELSRRFNVSHERIRQIEVAALKKLKSPERRKFFDGYY